MYSIIDCPFSTFIYHMWFSSPVRLYCTNPVAFSSNSTVIVMSSSLTVMFASIVVFLSSSAVNAVLPSLLLLFKTFPFLRELSLVES